MPHPPLENPDDGPLLEALQKRMFGPDYLSEIGAHGVGVGRRVKDKDGGRVTGQLVINVYVPVKPLTRDQVPSGVKKIPEKIEFDGQTLFTDVIECPPPRQIARTGVPVVNPRTHVRPACGGLSCSTVGVQAILGTIGGWARYREDKTVVMLSNEHVFGHRKDAIIIQQGFGDLKGNPERQLGVVIKGIERLVTGWNTVDCAIARPIRRKDVDPRVAGIGRAIYDIAAAPKNMQVEKFGRSSEHTFGEVTNNQWHGAVDMDLGKLWFEDIIFIKGNPGKPWAIDGDSGSLVFAQESNGSGIKPVVGLLFAASWNENDPTKPSYGYACKIQTVFAALDLEPLREGRFRTAIRRIVRGVTGRARNPIRLR